MALGDRVKTLRERRRWSQRELAERAGVRQALISRLESGRQEDTTSANVRKLAFALGCTVDFLTGYNGPEDPNRSLAEGQSLVSISPLLATTTPHGSSSHGKDSISP